MLFAGRYAALICGNAGKRAATKTGMVSGFAARVSRDHGESGVSILATFTW